MKIKTIFSAILMAMLVVSAPLSLTSCDGDDQLNTNQFSEGLSLLSFGPSPVARGGELRFIGTGLNNVQSITIPGCDEITDINRKSNREISIIVPKKAQPGYVVLHTANKDLTTRTLLSFTEPVGFAENEAMTPSPVKPGQPLTIKGSYLNLVQSVIFADEVAVEDFETSSADEPMEMTIKVVVPEEAKTGKIFLGFVATGDTLMNKVLSDEILEVILPAVNEKANLSGKKPGDKIVIAGSNLDLVTKLMLNNDSVSYSVSKAGDSISFELPANTPDSAIFTMYPASEVPVEIAVIGMTIPTELAATPAAELREGNEVIISGKDLDVVEKVTFPDGKDATFTLADGSIKTTCPEGFISGDLVLTCKSGIEVKIAIATQKPSFTSFEATTVSMGNDVTINGENLDLVSKVIYKGDLEGTVKEGGSATQIIVTMPSSGVESGKVTLVMANGETSETEELTIDAPVFCYFTEPTDLITTDEKEIKAGTIITTGCQNADHLTSIEVDGTAVQYIVNGDTILFRVTDEAGFSSKVKLISDNGEIEYDLSVVPNTSKKVVAWSGMIDLAWNDPDRVYVPASALNDVPEGAILHLCYTQKNGVWGQAQINTGNWQSLANWDATDEECDGTTVNAQGALVPTDIYGWFSDGELNRDTKFRLTAEVLERLRTNVDKGNCMIIQGQNLIFTQVYITWEISLETDIRDFITFEPGTPVSYPLTLDWNDAANGKLRIKREGLSKMKIGSKMYLYKEGTGQCQINTPNWKAIATAADWNGNVNPIEVVIDEEMMKCITGEVTDNWSTTAFIFQGNGLKITKITILP